MLGKELMNWWRAWGIILQPNSKTAWYNNFDFTFAFCKAIIW
jgi:hypothetical protein